MEPSANLYPLGFPQVAWLLLHAADNDALRFWIYVITALKKSQT
jgi:hypothetical protein